MALVGLVGVRNPKSCQVPWQRLRRKSRKERSKQKELHGFCENKSACKDQRTSLSEEKNHAPECLGGILAIQQESLERKW